MNRRHFLATAATGLLVAAAPAIVRPGVLMPVRPVPRLQGVPDPLAGLGCRDGDFWIDMERGLHRFGEHGWVHVRTEVCPDSNGALIRSDWIDGRLVS